MLKKLFQIQKHKGGCFLTACGVHHNRHMSGSSVNGNHSCSWLCKHAMEVLQTYRLPFSLLDIMMDVVYACFADIYKHLKGIFRRLIDNMNKGKGYVYMKQ